MFCITIQANIRILVDLVNESYPGNYLNCKLLQQRIMVNMAILLDHYYWIVCLMLTGCSIQTLVPNNLTRSTLQEPKKTWIKYLAAKPKITTNIYQDLPHKFCMFCFIRMTVIPIINIALRRCSKTCVIRLGICGIGTDAFVVKEELLTLSCKTLSLQESDRNKNGVLLLSFLAWCCPVLIV